MTRGAGSCRARPTSSARCGPRPAVTVDGLDALAAWAAGDEAAAARVRECEHLADDRKRELRAALSEAFSTPLEPEDIFQLSTGLDRVMNGGQEHRPRGRGDGAAAGSADGGAGRGARRGDAPPRRRRSRRSAAAAGRAATAAADAALESQRRVERTYRAAMSGLARARTTCTRSPPAASSTAAWPRTSDGLVDVAERVWYSVLKES